MINLYSLISLMILPRAYPDGVRIEPGENKYVRIYHYRLYQNRERLPFLNLILALSVGSASIGHQLSHSLLTIICPTLARLRAPGILHLIPLFLKRLAKVLSILPSTAPKSSTGRPCSLSLSTEPPPLYWTLG